jgi:DNA-directed RNA polymerase specialized sigma24 family protein
MAGGEQDPVTADAGTGLGLRQALAELPPEQARAIVQMAFCGLPAEEIAAQTDVPPGHRQDRIRRGLRALRQRCGVRDA